MRPARRDEAASATEWEWAVRCLVWLGQTLVVAAAAWIGLWFVVAGVTGAPWTVGFGTVAGLVSPFVLFRQVSILVDRKTAE